ncbi:hypothetical protein KW445_14440 [Vibrio fluvialis]|uniref:hypothetical protein n=1 Tax=Vibrio fluvialis TaxID=676 RepID=UPI001C9CE2A8|nr:hypothetical protein [Vibrio fluvialis]ELD1797645.1 hypothetical protein [Vibrio fluvialis]MBY7934875.1 hypothetical protein [Vibrio fluvialis]MBY7970833.1 hypothetical protein [Vibrio fluvialis]MCE7582090.1 hypothetical protein [Vibrio fluvialis]
MGVLFVAVVLVSGYLFSYFHISSHYRLTRTDGWHSYFFVAAQGIAFALIAMPIIAILDYYDVASNKLGLDISRLSIEPYVSKAIAWSLLTLLLSFIFGLLSQIRYSKNPKLRDEKILKLVHDNHFERFLLEASYTQTPIAITLGSRKIYIGICLGDELINSKNEHIAIIPLLSGHRDKDDLSVEITNNYQIHYVEEGIEEGKHTQLTKESFRIIVPTSEIESFSFFDVDTYIKFKKKEIAKKKQKLSDNTYPNTYYSSIKYSSNLDQRID